MGYGTDWAEDVAADEDTRLAALGARLVAIQEDRDVAYGEKGRALHRKGLGGARGRFTVREDLAEVLPTELHVGPFQPGAAFDAIVRFSNGTFKRQPDKVPDVRGVAIKLLDVPGIKVLTGTEEPRAQDFLVIPGTHTPMASPDDFVRLLELLASGSEATLPLRMLWAFGPLQGLKILRGVLSGIRTPFPSFPAGRFHSATPFRFGPTAARFSLAPRVSDTAPPSGPDFYADHLRTALTRGVTWDFQVQLYQDARTTPIEDNSVQWTEAASAFLTVATLDLPAVDVESEAFVTLQGEVEAMTFDPWQCVEALRPVGAMNRARKHAYYASMKHRGVLP